MASEPDAPPPDDKVAVSSVTELSLEAIAALAGREPVPIRSSSAAAASRESPPSTATTDNPVESASRVSAERRPSPTAPPARPASGRHPLPSAAPSDSPASSSSRQAASLSRRASPTHAFGARSGQQDKMSAPEEKGRDTEATPASKPATTHHPAADGDRAAASRLSPVHALKDEIVVDTQTNGVCASPIHVASDLEDVPVAHAGNESPELSNSKRKRPSNDTGVEDAKAARPEDGNDIWRPAPRGRPPKAGPRTPPVVNNKSIVLGYWRDSTVPDVKERHVVVGFIDTRDRLRTRVQQVSRTGNRIPPDHPLPPGPGGGWVTFDRIVFEQHLIGLEHNQVKEYVKIRTETLGTPETPEEAVVSEKAAVKEAMRRAAMHPVSDTMPAPQVAYGVDLPDYVVNASRPEKKRRLASGYATVPLASSDGSGAAAHDSSQQANGGILPPSGSPSVVSAIERSAIDLLPGTRPTKILLGYWRGSSEERVENKHAVFGILGANDMFRVKVTRETRDGRPVLGNFPQGAGALWIHYDEVEFEKHIRHLSRPEVKEYVRVRQRQLDEGETPGQRAANEAKAVKDAQERVLSAGGAAQSTLGTTGRVDTISFATAANLNREISKLADSNGAHVESPYHVLSQDGLSRRESTGHELRPIRRTMDAHEATATSIAAAAIAASTPQASRSGRHSLPDSASVSRTPLVGHGPLSEVGSNGNPNADRVERTNSLARREITRMESIQQRSEQRAAHRDSTAVTMGGAAGEGSSGLMGGSLYGPGSGHPSTYFPTNGSGSTPNGGTSSRQAFTENIGRLNKVWAAQEATRLRAVGEDAKIFRGVKYERKQTGPFQGKLVSPGTILSIDGEDYVEYRVLTKPTFF